MANGWSSCLESPREELGAWLIETIRKILSLILSYIHPFKTTILPECFPLTSDFSPPWLISCLSGEVSSPLTPSVACTHLSLNLPTNHILTHTLRTELCQSRAES